MRSAASMSAVTIVQYASSTEVPARASSPNWSSYSSDPAMAFWKIVGLDVMPRTPRSTQRASSPPVIHPRRKLSSQGLWPCSR